MEGSAHNWLSFSLSHHHGLFEAFSTPPPPPPPHLHVGGEEGGGEEPKLADFLGGGGGGGAPPLAAEEEMSCGGEGELGSIAAGFLRGFATAEPPSSASAAAAAAEPRRVAEESTFGQRTSIYRGVTRWTGRYEAHLWDNSCRREGQSRKGRQGGYDKEEKAARAYDLAALKYWGPNATTNFPVSNYEKELEEMKTMTRQEFVASLRRKSSGFSRGASIYRGVTRHHQHGRWQARIGRVAGNKDLYLGTFSTQEEAAEAYDIAAIKFRGLNAVTNFDMSRYDVEAILNSDLPIGSLSSKASKVSSDASSMTSASELRPGRSAEAPSQGGQDYWSLLAHHYHQQELYNASSGFEVFGSGVNVDFSASSGGGGGGGNSYGGGVMWSGGGAMAHQMHDNRGSSSSSSACSNIPYATPIVMGGNYESSNSNVGSWGTAPSYFYNYQGATSNASAMHTALYGME
ncbi:AP2-like ethylene-responsive transcription factor AIL5 [Ananas comosus]|uniref:AP2-like ethylene-responsive transcription factor AIL5 n=1 Tax=Ananas comosus TaxID=4615 RepID=A0A199UY51_ANACO|nr:AP2-like ethylene-responsive transcription factor AIL5 [Ananas comosus]